MASKGDFCAPDCFQSPHSSLFQMQVLRACMLLEKSIEPFSENTQPLTFHFSIKHRKDTMRKENIRLAHRVFLSCASRNFFLRLKKSGV